MEKGIEDMCEGEIRRVLVPSDMGKAETTNSVMTDFLTFNSAYGELGMPGAVPPDTAIIYDIELIKVNSPFTNPWFYAGLVTIAVSYMFFSRMSDAADRAKAAKFLASRSGEAQSSEESKKDQ
ncbi:hypothetical protein BX666DRAFT_1964342 [Dichotomocladium elegans]|nr:hypothetical protein BX666DRAFT_1964342 [Dichotomocladium elegans]